VPPSNRVIEINRRKFVHKYGSLKMLDTFLKSEGMDLSRQIFSMKDPSNAEVFVFWQSLPNEFLTDVNGKVL